MKKSALGFFVACAIAVTASADWKPKEEDMPKAIEKLILENKEMQSSIMLILKRLEGIENMIDPKTIAAIHKDAQKVAKEIGAILKDVEQLKYAKQASNKPVATETAFKTIKKTDAYVEPNVKSVVVKTIAKDTMVYGKEDASGFILTDELLYIQASSVKKLGE